MRNGGAMALAICDPVLTIETGIVRSPLANQSCDALSPEAKNGDSATPSNARAM